MSPLPRIRERLRRRAGALIVDNAFRGAAAIGRLHPRARAELARVRVVRDVPYRDTGLPEHRLDVYRPAEGEGPWPVVLYAHGGGFRILSKDTHWIMALAFARQGFLVANISYRLAPRHPFPAAIEDACAAYAWTVRNAARHGGDTSRLVLAGESAGANLVTALALCACTRRPEPFAREVFDAGVVPAAVVPACGMLQVTDPRRFGRRRSIPSFIQDRLIEVTEAYLRGVQPAAAGDLDLCDPLVALERGDPPDRPLPAFFVPCGTRDPLLEDSRRLGAALRKLGARCDVRVYPGEPHAFHALAWREPARRCWAHTFRFLDRVLAGEASQPSTRLRASAE